MPVANPPHKPPWFPEGDELDPLTSGIVPVKLPQRYTGDTNQLYDVITTYTFYYSPAEYWKLLPCDKYFISPLYTLDKGFNNNANGFLMFERFAPGISGFFADYVDKVFDMLEQLKNLDRTDLPIEFLTKDKYWDTGFVTDSEGNTTPVVNGKGTFFGENVKEPPYEKSVEVDNPTTIQFTWIEMDADRSYKLNTVAFSGKQRIDFNWQPNTKDGSDTGKVLPWSGQVTVLKGDDITEEIKSQLPEELIADNSDFPTIDAKDDDGNDLEDTDEKEDEKIKLLVYEFNQTIRTETVSHEVVPWFSDDFCCPPYVTHLWGIGCEYIDSIANFLDNLPQDKCDITNGFLNSNCDDTRTIEVTNADIDPDEANWVDEWGEGYTFPNNSVVIGNYSGKFWVDRLELDSNVNFQESNQEKYKTFNLDDPYEDEEDEEFDPPTQFVNLSRANYNRWSAQDLGGSDRGEDIKLFYNPETELKIQNTYFLAETDADEDKLPPNQPLPEPFNECESTSSNTVNAKETTTVNLRGRGIVQFPGNDPGNYSAVTEDSSCENGWSQAYRDKEYVSFKKETFEDETTCEIKYPDRNGDSVEEDEPPKSEPLPKQQAITTIDEYWYEYQEAPPEDNVDYELVNA